MTRVGRGRTNRCCALRSPHIRFRLYVLTPLDARHLAGLLTGAGAAGVDCRHPAWTPCCGRVTRPPLWSILHLPRCFGPLRPPLSVIRELLILC